VETVTQRRAHLKVGQKKYLNPDFLTPIEETLVLSVLKCPWVFLGCLIHAVVDSLCSLFVMVLGNTGAGEIETHK
jgi:hypothetical protein